jgi:signal transduction histidine kinase
MNFQILAKFISGFIILAVGIVVLLKNRKERINVILSLACLSLFIWLFGFAMMQFVPDEPTALNWARIAFCGIIFIPITMYQFFTIFFNEEKKPVIIALYSIGLFFLCIDNTNLIYKGFYHYPWGRWPMGGSLYIVYSLFFAALFFCYHCIIFSHLHRKGLTSKQVIQSRYLLVSSIVATFGIGDFIAKFGIPLYPVGFAAALGWILIIAYATVKHNLLNVSVTITRAGIFVFVYAIVLGLPLWLAYGSGLGKHAIWVMLLFATIGPFIYTKLRLAVEQALFKQQKLQLAAEEQGRRQRAMDNFSASLAHEIQNPVVAVMGRASMVRESVLNDLKGKIDEKLIRYYSQRLEGIEEDVSRIANIIKAVREYSAQAPIKHTTIKIDELVQSFLYLAGPQFKQDEITLNTDIEPNLTISGNKVQLEEVLLNLADNAIHAAKSNESDKQVWLTIKSIPDNKISIEFKDNGYGIPKRILEDIFLDFVTTKGSSEGLGMGLSRARKIIALHKGKIWAESKGEGKGAAIFVELPLV